MTRYYAATVAAFVLAGIGLPVIAAAFPPKARDRRGQQYGAVPSHLVRDASTREGEDGHACADSTSRSFSPVTPSRRTASRDRGPSAPRSAP